MMHATYIGPVEHLRGKTAVVFVKDGAAHAQFDDRCLTLNGVLTAPLCCEPRWPAESLGFGWHVFPLNDFDVTTPSAC